MQTTKKKPNILLIVLGAVLASYLGYLVAGAWREGIEFNAFLERFEMVGYQDCGCLTDCRYRRW